MYVSFFRCPRNDLETREACFSARFHSYQNQNPTNPHPSHHPTAAVQPQAAVQSKPTSAAKHSHGHDQYTKAAVQPPAARPAQPPPGSRQASGGDGRGRTSRVHTQGDGAARVGGLVEDASQRVRRCTRWAALMATMTFEVPMQLHSAAGNALISLS